MPAQPPIPTQADLETLAARVGERLLARGQQLATAESCTGGWIGQVLTAIAGSSAWYEQGLIAYANAAKLRLLGVAPATLAAHGAVSEPTAREMAQGARAGSCAQWSLAVTGIAGPSGGSPDKPVGTVCFAWTAPDGTTATETRCFSGDREAVRAQTVHHALSGLLERLDRG